MYTPYTVTDRDMYLYHEYAYVLIQVEYVSVGRYTSDRPTSGPKYTWPSPK